VTIQTKAIEQYVPVVLIKMVPTCECGNEKPKITTIQIKATEQYFHALQFGKL